MDEITIILELVITLQSPGIKTYPLFEYAVCMVCRRKKPTHAKRERPNMTLNNIGVDLRVISRREYFTLPICPKIEPYHQK